MPDSAGTAQVTGASGTQIYDVIMSQIEPDLVSSMAAELSNKYISETKQQHDDRMERYKRAFELYDKCFSAFMVAMTDEAKKAKFSARTAAEAKSRSEDEQAESGLLSQISSI